MEETGASGSGARGRGASGSGASGSGASGRGARGKGARGNGASGSGSSGSSASGSGASGSGARGRGSRGNGAGGSHPSPYQHRDLNCFVPNIGVSDDALKTMETKFLNQTLKEKENSVSCDDYFIPLASMIILYH